MNPAPVASLAAFVAILVFVVTAALAGVRRVAPDKAARTANFFAFWLVCCSAYTIFGFAETKPMPFAVVFLVASNLAGFGFAFSPVGTALAAGMPTGALVAFQTFRLPLEFVLHQWAEAGTIPETMTWTGQNLDIVSGIVCLVLAPVAARHRAAAWTANVVGFALLLNVMRVAIMSTPLPFAWGTQPPLELAFHMPYALIVPVCVAGALSGHLILTRHLLRRT